MKSHRVRICQKLALLALLVALAGKLGAQTIFNPSFEANSFSAYPGYSAANGAIAGWTGLYPTEVGLSPADGNPFADNGTVPEGNNVAFIQTLNTTNWLATTISNLTVGITYRVTCRINSRVATAPPTMWLGLNGATVNTFTVTPMHALNVAGPQRFCVWNFHRHQHHRRPGGHQPLRHRSFTANTNASSRTGNITLLGQTIAVTQANVAVTSPSISGAEILVSGAFQMSFNSQSGVSFTVLSTTNLALPVARWSVLGAAVETPAGSGQYQFTDPSTTNQARYYLVRTP